MFNHAASNQDLVMGVARAEFMLIGGVASAIGYVLIFVPEKVGAYVYYTPSHTSCNYLHGHTFKYLLHWGFAGIHNLHFGKGNVFI